MDCDHKVPFLRAPVAGAWPWGSPPLPSGDEHGVRDRRRGGEAAVLAVMAAVDAEHPWEGEVQTRPSHAGVGAPNSVSFLGWLLVKSCQ